MEPSYEDKTLSQWEFDLKHGEVAERCAAALALAEIGPEKQPVMNALVNGVLDPDKAVQVACCIAIGFIKMEAQARRNIFHDLTVGNENVKRGWVEILRWTQGDGAPSAPPAAAEERFMPSEYAEANPWKGSDGSSPDIRIGSSNSPPRPAKSALSMKPYVYTLGGLGEDARAYLAAIAKTQGAGAPGVFVAQESRAGWIDLAPPVFLLTLTIGSSWIARYLAPAGAQFYFAGQFVLAVLTCVLFVHTIRKLRAVKRGIGSFLYADREYLWDVNALNVKVLPLASLTEARIESGTPGSFHDHVVLDFYGRTYRTAGIPSYTAHDLFKFAQDVATRNASDQPADEGNEIPHIPAPSWGHVLRRLAPSLVATTIGVVFALGILRPANGFMREEYLHGKVSRADADDADPSRAYLVEFPSGRYVDEVQTQMLAACKAQADQDKNPAPLRRFLAECSDPTLQAQARKEIQQGYERKAADYRKVAADANGNPQIIQGFSELLQALGSIDLAPGKGLPTVAVAFRGTHDREPVDQVTKFMEDLARLDLKNGVLRTPPDKFFAADQFRQREKQVLDRFKRALRSRVSEQHVSLIAEPRPMPNIEITYHISPAGDFFTWKETLIGGAPLKKNPWDPLPLPKFNFLPLPDPVWLVRQYNIDWTMTIMPPKTDRRFTAGAKIINTRKTVRWTTKDILDAKRDPYVFIMDMMMLDFSDQLISAAGLPPQARPAADAKED